MDETTLAQIRHIDLRIDWNKTRGDVSIAVAVETRRALYTELRTINGMTTNK